MTVQQFTSADLNGDGAADLVCCGQVGGAVMFMNTTPAGGTTASFGPLIYVPLPVPFDGQTGVEVSSVAVGDFNGDGRADVVVGSTSGTALAVFPNGTTTSATTPTFAVPVLLPAAQRCVSVHVADINGDGKPDVLYLGAGLFDQPHAGIYLNTTGTGSPTPTFASEAVIPFGSQVPRALASGDFNGDGRVDVTALCDNGPPQSLGGGSTYDPFVACLVNQTATADPTASLIEDVRLVVQSLGDRFGQYSFPGLPAQLTSDINGDLRPDILVLNGCLSGQSNLSLFPNTTATGSVSPTFSTRQDVVQASVFVIADINGDGRSDVISTMNGGSNFTVLRNTTTAGASTASFAAAAVIPLASPGSAGSSPAMTALDVNRDGKPDIVLRKFVFLNTTP